MHGLYVPHQKKSCQYIWLCVVSGKIALILVVSSIWYDLREHG
jgi:hypothetical protein